MNEVDTTNRFGVAILGNNIMLFRTPPQLLSRQDALVFAAYLVALADDDDSFPAILEAIQEA